MKKINLILAFLLFSNCLSAEPPKKIDPETLSHIIYKNTVLKDNSPSVIWKLCRGKLESGYVFDRRKAAETLNGHHPKVTRHFEFEADDDIVRYEIESTHATLLHRIVYDVIFKKVENENE